RARPGGGPGRAAGEHHVRARRSDRFSAGTSGERRGPGSGSGAGAPQPAQPAPGAHRPDPGGPARGEWGERPAAHNAGRNDVAPDERREDLISIETAYTWLNRFKPGRTCLSPPARFLHDQINEALTEGDVKIVNSQ